MEDSGPGIAPEAVRKLFVPFSSTKADGTGLGLVVAKISTLHGASVTAAARQPSGGPSFRIAFCRAPVPAADEVSPGTGFYLISPARRFSTSDLKYSLSTALSAASSTSTRSWKTSSARYWSIPT
ncbi:MAG: ATP-binding protein, partial [Holophagales bacterium]|nr:ATP-binding protein [Holophagales bacterium]